MGARSNHSIFLSSFGMDLELLRHEVMDLTATYICRKGDRDIGFPVWELSTMSLTISRESIWLTAVCLVDAVLTIILVALGIAQEANPLMNYWMQRSLALFFIVKMATVLLAIIAAEYYKRYNPVFVKRVLTLAVFAYIGIYVIGITMVNLF